MLPLVALSQQQIDCIVARVPGGAANVQDIFPLAPLQEGILFQHLLEGDGDPYLGRWLLSFDTRGRLDRFLQALQTVIDRHDVLRRRWCGRTCRSRCRSWCAGPRCRCTRSSRPPTATGGAAARTHRLRDGSRMDLSRAPLMAAYVAATDGKRWLLSLVVHHIVIDHVSEEILLREIEADSRRPGRPARGAGAVPRLRRAGAQRGAAGT